MTPDRTLKLRTILRPLIPPQTETANSSYVVTDPMTIEDIGDADAVTFETIIGTGASLTLGSVASFVSYSGSDTTTLNELGTIWSWTWSASGSDPGHWSFSFVSNPSLGLDDAAIVSEFNTLVFVDPLTHVYSLSGDLDVVATIDIAPGQISYSYGGNNSALATDAVAGAPEPSTWAMVIFGFAGLGFLRFRPRLAG